MNSNTLPDEVRYEQSRHVGPCDGMGYKQDCSMCSGFVERFDGTLVHDDGTIFAPVEEINQPSISYRLNTKESSKRW